ncbi:MAG: tRNA threonylcarbamoyladenosine dehydratase [Proteobacteria bacterium]|nr:tRNA threonylcarbamoyladenosine dehydratase [Pseudomonadota bacterium]
MAETRVILFGVGGVGSWCAEALIRSGLGHLTIVDSDVVCITNVNRQLETTSKNVGKSKVTELRRRLREINPDADVQAVKKKFNFENADQFGLEEYDYVIDAIDSIANKVLLIFRALKASQEGGLQLFSAMGASSKLDPTRIKVASFWKVRGCALAKHTRKRVRTRLTRNGIGGDFLCVYSDEKNPRFDVESACLTHDYACSRSRMAKESQNGCSADLEDVVPQINGSLVHVTASFGFQLAGLVIQDIVRRVGDFPVE